MKVRTILYLLTFALLIYLLAESFLQIDIAPSKNQHLINSSKTQVDNMQNIDSVKAEAKNWVDVNRHNFLHDSRNAKKRILFLVALLVIQVVLIARNHQQKT